MVGSACIGDVFHAIYRSHFAQAYSIQINGVFYPRWGGVSVCIEV